MLELKAERYTFIEISVWIALGASILMLLLVNMEWQYAVIRCGVITGGFFLAHYYNSFIFHRYLIYKKVRHYLAYAVLFMLGVAVLRYAMEVYLLPEATRPFYFSSSSVRPVFLFSTTMVVMFVSTVILYALYLSAREKEILKIINTGKEAKLQYLQAQINPHFLFNALNNIYSLSITGSPRTPEMLLTLTDMLRYSVYQKEREKVSVADELSQIEFLIKLFNLKSDDTYNIALTTSDIQGYIEPMILVPLAENCLKHCDFGANDNAYAIMKLETNATTIKFTTENTFSNDVLSDISGGVGVPNITERLQLLYANRHEMITTDSGNIYKVQLTIQWKNY